MHKLIKALSTSSRLYQIRKDDKKKFSCNEIMQLSCRETAYKPGIWRTDCTFKGNGWPSKVVAFDCLLQPPLKLQLLFPQPFCPKYCLLASRFHHLQFGSADGDNQN